MLNVLIGAAIDASAILLVIALCRASGKADDAAVEQYRKLAERKREREMLGVIFKDIPKHVDCKKRLPLIPIEEDRSISYDQFDAEEGFFDDGE